MNSAPARLRPEDRPIDLVKAVFEQHWLHARHAENERLLLVSVYSTLLGACVAALREEFLTPRAAPLHFFLEALSVFAILFSLKIDAVFKGHARLAEMLLNEHGIPLMEEGLLADHWVNRNVSISRLYPLYFTLCGCGVLALLLRSVWPLLPVFLGVPVVLFLSVYSLLRRLRYDYVELPRLRPPNQQELVQKP